MYEYIPKPDRRPALFLTLLLSVASVCCMLPTSPALTAPLRALGVLCALAAIMLAERFLLRGFSYAVGGDGSTDLTVTVLRGVRCGRTVCRVSASGGKLERYSSAARSECRAEGIAVINYCVDIFPEVSYIFIPAEALNAAKAPELAHKDELCAIRFQPDAALAELLENMSAAE